MYTSFGLLALAGSLVTAEAPSTVAWQKDYSTALAAVGRSNKPLAVIVGKGRQGQAQVAQEGKLSPSALDLLAKKYVCLYLDADSPAGGKLVKDLAIVSGKGLVISDSRGGLMAFHHDGSLSSSDLQKHLVRFSDPNQNITTTTTHNSRVSYYPASSAGQPAVYAPTINC